ncbi:hypothetical protein ACG9H2_16520, partial [Acinetobacter ursingii]|uniref:hypothetical protein n=1 Tax=Acinetobacter ursingii TaxID=108980 RepID=UPI003AF512B4
LKLRCENTTDRQANPRILSTALSLTDLSIMRHLHLSIARSSFIPFIQTGCHSSPVYNLDLLSIHELQQVFFVI